MLAWILFLLATISLVLVPFAPQLLRIRLRFLRWIGWRWAANLLENHFDRWVTFLRIFLILLAAVLLYFGWANLRA